MSRQNTPEHTFRHAALSVVLAALGIGSAACQLPASAPSLGGTAQPAAQLELCTSEINRYRSVAGRPPLARSEALERFAAEAARHDATAGIPHLLFTTTNGGDGVAKAETQLLRWTGYPVSDVIRRGLAEMWAGGPGESHYDVLLGDYTEVGCGIFVSGRQVSVTQDYR